MDLTDIHCHIIPQVDDGAKDLEEAKEMLRMEYRDGVRRIILTPHYRQGMFETAPERIEQQFEKVKQEAASVGADLQVYLGCEYHSHSEMKENLKAGIRPTMGGSDYVLIEFSANHTFSKIRSQIYELISEGYRPILAHIERYPALVEDLSQIEELIRLGAYMQVNAAAVTGEVGFRTKYLCKTLMKEGMVHFIATDAHGSKLRKPELAKCAVYIEKKMGKAFAREIFVDNPNKILAGTR